MGEVCQDADGDKSSGRKWKQVVTITKQFCKRWLSEYLPILQQRKKWQSNQEWNVGNSKGGQLATRKVFAW